MAKLMASIFGPVFSISGEAMTDAGTSKPDLSSSTNAPSALKSLVVVAIVPLIVLAGLFWRSPNHRWSDIQVHQTLGYPMGGDYLQEYVGGFLIQQSKRQQLYDAEAFRDVQHDANIVGFSWDEQQFFPAVYPPFWYDAVSPLSNLPYQTAATVWLVLMTLMLIAAVWLLNRYANVPAPILIVMCLAAPVIESLNAGQKGTLLLLIISASYVLLRQRRDLLSGLVFALIVFKPHLAIVPGIWMLVTKRWSWCAGAILGAAAVIIFSFLISPESISDYANVVLGFGDYVQSGGYNLNESFSCWSFWQQLVSNSSLAKVLTAVTSLLLLGVSLWSSRSQSGRSVSAVEVDKSFAAMVIVTMITSPHLYAYDLTMLILPIGLLTRLALGTKTASQPAEEGLAQERNYTDWLPVGLLILAMFASGAIASFAARSGIQLGVLLLLAASIAITRPWSEVIPRAS